MHVFDLQMPPKSLWLHQMLTSTRERMWHCSVMPPMTPPWTWLLPGRLMGFHWTRRTQRGLTSGWRGWELWFRTPYIITMRVPTHLNVEGLFICCIWDVILSLSIYWENMILDKLNNKDLYPSGQLWILLSLAQTRSHSIYPCFSPSYHHPCTRFCIDPPLKTFAL